MIANLIVSFSGLVGFITVFLILLRYKSNRITNIYLIIVFLIISIRMSIIGIFSLEYNSILTLILSKYNNLLIVIVPCMYLYFDNLIKDDKNFQTRNSIHFVIPLVFNIVDYANDNQYLNINNVNYYYSSFFALYSITYFLLMYLLLKFNVWNRQGEIGVAIKQNQLLKNWSFYLFSVIVIVGVRLIITLFWEINNHSYNFGVSYLWVSAIFWLILYFKIIVSPEILYGYSFLIATISENKKADKPALSFWSIKTTNTITNLQDNQLNTKIEKYVLEYMESIDQFSFNNQDFRQMGFSLADLSIKLNIPKSHITFIFKYHSKISFSEYKKIVRIHDSLGLIKEGFLVTNTFDSLAKEVGFKSYNTFFVSFKDYTGDTPQEYLVKLSKNKNYS
jgi:AraC-like DNA-binding protein